MTIRIGSFALTLTVLLPACGDDKGETSQATATSDSTTGGSTTSQPTTGDGSTTDGTATDDTATDDTVTDGTATDGSTSSPTTGGTGGGIKEDCDAADAASYQIDLHDCGCAVEEMDFVDVESCLMVFGSDQEGQALKACACEVEAVDPSNASVEACRRVQLETFAACVTPLACSDSVGRDACFDAFFDFGCGLISMQSLAQIALQCEGAAPFMCGSGETIPDYWTCDGTNDCMDGSDEQKC